MSRESVSETEAESQCDSAGNRTQDLSLPRKELYPYTTTPANIKSS